MISKTFLTDNVDKIRESFAGYFEWDGKKLVLCEQDELGPDAMIYCGSEFSDDDPHLGTDHNILSVHVDPTVRALALKVNGLDVVRYGTIQEDNKVIESIIDEDFDEVFDRIIFDTPIPFVAVLGEKTSLTRLIMMALVAVRAPGENASEDS